MTKELNMYKKTLWAVALAAATLSNTASASFMDRLSVMAAGFSPSGAIKTLAKNPSDDQAAIKLQDVIVSSPESARRSFIAWQNEEDQSLYPQWAEVGLNMLRWVEPGHTYDWKHGVKMADGHLAYQQDGLVDLERTQAITQDFKVVTEEVRGFNVWDGAQPIRPVPSTSERLLSEGSAPVGPDNRPILLCRLGAGSQAPYVEMTEGQRHRFGEITGLSISSCLSGSQSYAYWKNRYADFVDGYYDRTSRHHPGESRP